MNKSYEKPIRKIIIATFIMIVMIIKEVLFDFSWLNEMIRDFDKLNLLFTTTMIVCSIILIIRSVIEIVKVSKRSDNEIDVQNNELVEYHKKALYESEDTSERLVLEYGEMLRKLMTFLALFLAIISLPTAISSKDLPSIVVSILFYILLIYLILFLNTYKLVVEGKKLTFTLFHITKTFYFEDIKLARVVRKQEQDTKIVLYTDVVGKIICRNLLFDYDKFKRRLAMELDEDVKVGFSFDDTMICDSSNQHLDDEINEKEFNESEENVNSFVVSPPNDYCILGILMVVIMIILSIILTLTADKPIHPMGYAFFGSFILIGVILALLPLKTKMVVEGNTVTKYNFIGSYTFNFSDIVSVKRKIETETVDQMEWVVIITNKGKRIRVYNSYIAYELLVKRIKMAVSSDKLKGFEIN